ncbi:MAG: dTDP-4-dehydrorhamnose reductase [Planctomycetota bacterium]
MVDGGDVRMNAASSPSQQQSSAAQSCRKALITGMGGQLARELVATASNHVEIVTLDQSQLDISDHNAVLRALREISPDVLFNAAAYTAVDLAEKEPEVADRVNHLAVGFLADAARASGARLVHVSTDYVFDGLSPVPYQPNHPTAPASVYGRTKRDGELAARQAPSALVVRTAWVYAHHGKNFVATMLRLMSERDEVRVVADQVGTPTSASSLARALWNLVGAGASGTYHWTDAGVASWYDFAVAIREEAAALGATKIGRVRVTPIRTVDYPTPARRPAMSVLSKDATWALIGPARHWREELRQVLSRMELPK